MLRCVATVLMGLVLAMPVHADDRPATIALSGTGQVMVAPDIVTIHVGVDIQKDTAAEALEANSAQASAVIETLKAAGLGQADIQTTNFSVSPVYSDRKSLSSGGPSVSGYRVINQVAARLRDLDALGDLLDRLVGDGANRINGISFGVEDDAAALDAARALAVEDARHKATIYAKAANMALGEIVSISEGGASASPRGGAVFAMAERSRAPIEQGETGISAQVTIVWTLTQP